MGAPGAKRTVRGLVSMKAKQYHDFPNPYALLLHTLH